MMKYYSTCIFLFWLLLSFEPVHAEIYSYDVAGRLVGVTYDDGTAISYTYDKSGTIINRNVVGGSAAVMPPSPPSIDLSLTMTGTPDPILSGRNITYTLSVTNNGPDIATNVEIYDALPLTVVFVSAASSQGSCNMAGHSVFCAAGSMANAATMTVTMVVTATASGVISNTATGSVPGSLDPVGANNTVTQVTTVQVDTDGDGIADTLDAFPLDPAASVDSDGDGIPDAWNVNATQAQIAASKLVLDPAPAIAEQFPYPDFGQMPLGADGGWHQSIDFAIEGGVSLKSDVISHNQVAAIERTGVFVGSAIRFSHKVSSESGFDFLRFYIDGVEQGAWSGEKGWTAVNYPLADGSHTLKWAYEKDGAVTHGSDAAWIDGVLIGTDTDRDGVPDTFDAFPNDTAASVDTDGDGHPDQWNIAATSAQIAQSSLILDAYPNNSNRFLDDIPPVVTPPMDITVAPTDAMAVSIPVNTFLSAATAVDIPDGQIFTISNDAPGVFPMGSTMVTFAATDTAGNTGLASASVTVQDPVQEIFPKAGVLPVGWAQTATTNGSWHVASDFAHLGLFSLRSDPITNNQLASIESTGNFATGAISFSYRVSSEKGFDFLRFYIDGIEQGAWSGEQGWATISFSVGAGTHTVKWEYSKDGAVSRFSDAAWIDDVVLPLASVTDKTAPVITLLGATPVTVAPGLIYTDAGATATDNVDGDITANIVTINPVNTASIGTYTVTYNVKDAAGNAATQVVRTVNVVTANISQTYNLTGGWNLISFPMDLGTTGLTDFLTAVPIATSVWTFVNGGWQSFTVGAPSFLNSLKLLEAGKGYWVQLPVGVTKAVTLSGPPMSVTPNLVAASGWNLIGVTTPVTDMAGFITSTGAASVWTFSNGQWQSFVAGTPVFLNSLQGMNAGVGYYVNMK